MILVSAAALYAVCRQRAVVMGDVEAASASVGGYELVRICDGYEYERLEPRRRLLGATSLSTTPRNVVLRTNPKQLFSYSATRPGKQETRNHKKKKMGTSHRPE